MKRLARLPRVMFLLGITSTEDPKEARNKQSTFNRRYRSNPKFPKPVGTPEGRLAWREEEVEAYIANLPTVKGDPREGVFVMRPGHTPKSLPGRILDDPLEAA